MLSNGRFLGRAAARVGALAVLVLAAACSTERDPSSTDDENLGQTQDALNANEHTAYDFFVAKGLKNFQAAGIVGNLIQESNVDPNAIQYGGGPGRGIAQWSVGGRWNSGSTDSATWYASHTGQSVWSLNLQLEFIWYELNTFGYGFSQLKNSTTLSAATLAFQDLYEICGACNQSGRLAYAQQVLAAWGNTPPPPPPPPPVNVDGYIDAAGVSVRGWAADPNAGNTALKVDLDFGAAAGMGYGLTVTADLARPDVAAALHIGQNHGFDVPTPRYYCDNATHPVHAYGHDTNGMAVELKSSPKNLTCPPTDVGPGILRHVTSPPVLTAWSFDVRALLAWMTTADKSAHNVGSDWPDTLTLGRTADGAVWVVDGTTRRHVINPASLAAWHFSATALKAWTAADAAKYTVGLDLPAKPLLVQELGNPAVYVLDTEPPAPPPPGSTSATGTGSGSGAGGGASASGAGGSGGGSGSVTPGNHKGCSVSPAPTPGGAGWIFGIAALGAVVRLRRRRSA